MFNLFSGKLIERALREGVPNTNIEDKRLNTNVDNDKLIYNESTINKRRTNIAKYLNDFLPNVVSKLISDYDYYLEGKIYTFSKNCRIDNCFAILPDKRIVGSCENDVTIHNPETGDCEGIFKGHTDRVSCIAVLPDGRIVTGSCDNTLRLWNVQSLDITKEPVQTQHSDVLFFGHIGAINCVNVLPDGRIISGSADTSLKIWNVQTGLCDITFKEHTTSINRLFVLSDGRIVSGSDNETIKNWDSTTGICNFTIRKKFIRYHTCIVLTDDRIVSIIDNTIVKIYNSKTGLCDITFERNKLLGSYNYTFIMNELPDGRIMIKVANDTIKIIILEDLFSKVVQETGDNDLIISDNSHDEICYDALLLSDGRIIMTTTNSKLKIIY
jgi:WD40 repeat protein